MNPTQEKALLHLTGKPGLSLSQKQALQQVADESPYFAPARFFLTAGAKQHGSSPAWISQAQKTNLYFTNPWWLQYQLDDITTEELTEEEIAVTEVTRNTEDSAESTVDAVKEAMRRVDPSQETTGGIEDEPMPDEYIEENEAMTEATDNKIAGILSGQLADFRKPLDKDAELDIDADKKRLHTIDYFASQGIKIDLTAIPQDKLTTHLLKFTDWLKQVKTANVNPAELHANLEMEKAVAETAKNSNETREVVTESMADVLEKQGQIDKAIQLYIKLSFLNPEKSSYFAAKIEQLKGI
ncbi:MAG: hypothetical protein JWQ30_1370 [Sediminibacterium sp.]|nr:hypothetical protein [Sediminibacterium sp.]